MKDVIDLRVALAMALSFQLPERPEAEFLLKAGWIPLGPAARSGIPGWGKVIPGGQSVVEDEADALRIAGWHGAAN